MIYDVFCKRALQYMALYVQWGWTNFRVCCLSSHIYMCYIYTQTTHSKINVCVENQCVCGKSMCVSKTNVCVENQGVFHVYSMYPHVNMKVQATHSKINAAPLNGKSHIL